MNDLDPIDTLGAPPAPAEPQLTEPSAGTPAAPAPAEQLYEVKIDGKTHRVPLSELTAGYSRTKDYTQKTMALADKERKWQETERSFQQEREQLKGFLADPRNVQKLYTYLVQQKGYSDPQQPLTAEQAEQIATSRAEQLINQRLGEAQLQMRQQQLETTYKAEIDTTIKGLLTQHPELKSVRGIDLILKQEAAKQQPADLDEAKQLIAQIAGEQAADLKKYWTEQAKGAAIAAPPQPPANGIEPPGGAPPMPAAKPMPKLNDPRLREEAIAFMNAQLSHKS